MRLNNNGFTLIEVLAVIVVIAVLGGIAIPNVLSSINTSKDKSLEIMISNIVTSSKSLYEEVEYGSGEKPIYQYSADGTKTSIQVTINDTVIETNLQTLVSNGFLEGTCKDSGNNSNCVKVLINPKTKDNIGKCEIKIKKMSSDSGKVSYTVVPNGSGSGCPDGYKESVHNG